MSSTVYSNDRMEKDEDKKKEDEVQEINKHTSVPDPLSDSCKRTTNNEWICTGLTKEKLEEAIPDKTEREKFLRYVLELLKDDNYHISVNHSIRGNPHTACIRSRTSTRGWLCLDLNQEKLEESLRRNEKLGYDYWYMHFQDF